MLAAIHMCKLSSFFRATHTGFLSILIIHCHRKIYSNQHQQTKHDANQTPSLSKHQISVAMKMIPALQENKCNCSFAVHKGPTTN